MADSNPLVVDGAVVAALNTGSRLELLVALRHEVAQTIDNSPSPRDLAALTVRLSDLDAEVRALQVEDDPVSVAQATSPAPWTP